MKLLLDDKAHCGGKLNANEACIYAAILKCTRAGRGWYGNYRELAAAMPFVMSHETARRAVQKLLNLGLVERREEKLFAVTQIVTDDTQNVTEPTQIVTSDAQNVLPPNNPPIINNNMNEKEREQQRALCARDCEEQQAADLSFEEFKKWYLQQDVMDLHDFERRQGACMVSWRGFTEVKRREILKKLEARATAGVDFVSFKPNPFFFLQDYPEPEPVFLSGQEQDKLRNEGIPLVQVRYNGKFLICTKAEALEFGLDIRIDPW
ncbi:MAG: hypothetical protein IJ718_05515 [Paludibacteraceae bacterium]|nr:hypothetical protein [Paludibacteraceae bacterium]